MQEITELIYEYIFAIFSVLNRTIAARNILVKFSQRLIQNGSEGGGEMEIARPVGRKDRNSTCIIPIKK